MKITFKIPGYYVGVYLNFRLAIKPREGTKVVGVCNKIADKYLLFLDYDYDNRKTLLPELRAIQEKYALGNAYLFKTGRGYHVIFTDLLTYDLFTEILDSTSCDKDFKQVPKNNHYRTWVLRATSKKENAVVFKEVLYNPQIRVTSAPHTQYLHDRGVPEVVTDRIRSFERLHKHKLLWATYEA